MDNSGNFVPTDNSGNFVPTDNSGNLVPMDNSGNLVPMDNSGNLVPMDNSGNLVPMDSSGNFVPTENSEEAIPVDNSGDFVPINNSGEELLSSACTEPMNIISQASLQQVQLIGAPLPNQLVGSILPDQLDNGLLQEQFAGAPLPDQIVSATMFDNNISEQAAGNLTFSDSLQLNFPQQQILPIERGSGDVNIGSGEELQLESPGLVQGSILFQNQLEEVMPPSTVSMVTDNSDLPVPNVVSMVPLGSNEPLTAVASATSETYLTSQYFVDNSKVEQNSSEDISYHDNITNTVDVSIPDEIVDSGPIELQQNGDAKPSSNENSDSEDKSKQSEFLTTCDLKPESLEDSSSRDSVVEIKKDEKKTDQKNSKVVEYEPEFVWEKYLEETNSQAVPPTAFKHVEYSLESGFVKGMKLEVPNKCNTDTYWVASVLMTCGQLLRLRFDGYEEDNTADFWCDLMTSEIHPIGWCAQNNQILQPPEAIKDKFDDWRDFLVRSLTGARTAPSYLLDKSTGIIPIDQLKQGMRLELQHPINPLEVWIVKIIENVGGRLYLRFEGVEIAIHDFWLFYLNYRLHPIGWAKSAGMKYQPPKELIMEDEDTDWMEILKSALKEAEKYVLPLAIFKDQEDISEHSFQEGWKLEALNPLIKNQICPATVIRVLNNHYFVVEIDDLESGEENKIKFSSHSGSKCIFPAKWCHVRGIPITSPKGWSRRSFSWNDYLKDCNAQVAPDSCFPEKTYELEFGQSMKMEAVNPEHPNQICAATISKVIKPLMWIHLDNSPLLGISHIEHFESHNLFPVGWCESNGYQLKVPMKTNTKKTAVVLPEISDATSEAYHMNKGGAWCPKVYYNHQCFSGPFLSKGRIASLPKCIGPGPICLVLKEAISMLINVAYKPCRALKELQLDGKPNPNMYQQTLKAKYKGKSYRAVVEFCKQADDLPEFCRKVCLKLECCPHILSPKFINGDCPDECWKQTKTKYTYYNPKKKVGRPPGGHTNLENGPKKPGKKKKKKRMNILSQGDTNGDDGSGEDDKDSIASDTKTVDSGEMNDNTEKGVKRKYVHQLPIPSDIKTRGAKLPKYSFEKKTHKKIPVQEKHHEHKPKKPQTKVENVSPVKNTMKLSSNPLHWSVKDVVNFIKSTECAPIARLFVEQEIDGQAMLLLTLPTVQEYLELKLGPAIKLCHHIERIKTAFFKQYAK